MRSSTDLLLALLLGAALISVAFASSRGRLRDPVDEDDDCDDNGYGSDGSRRVGATRPKSKAAIAEDDDDGVVEEPTDDDYLRYEDTNQEGICILQRGKCPEGDWRMFKRRNESVCLQAFGSPTPIDAVTAERICRKNANSRLMSLDNQAEREWLYTMPLARNGSYGRLLIAGRRDRKCHVAPWSCDKLNLFMPMDGTADHQYLNTKWFGPVNNYDLSGSPVDCLVIHTAFAANDQISAIRDHTCQSEHNTFLCGVTVM